MSSKQNAIVVEDVYKHFGDVKAVDGISLTAPAGKVLGLLGPNGAGKTTLVRILTTLLQPDSGQAIVGGIDIVKHPHQVRRLIGLAGQYPAVDEQLTGRENLVMVSQLYHFTLKQSRQRARELLERFDLVDAANRPVKTYSGGMRRRLDLAASLVARPEILFLDEPTTGLDPRTRIDLWTVIRELVQDGTTLLLTTQYLDEADELADRIVLLDHGKVIAEGTADELKAGLASDVIEVRIASAENNEKAIAAIADLGRENPQVDSSSGLITLSSDNGAATLINVVRAMDNAGVEIVDLSLRRPSLDDVFLELTGKPAESEPVPHAG